jgi:hypothetical protein
MPRTKIYTEEEALEMRRERSKAYQKKRYENDPEFRQKKIDRATLNNASQYEKIKQKRERLKELEAIFNNNNNNNNNS